jgi:hypothetical protein
MLKYFDALQVPVWAEWLGVVLLGIVLGAMVVL